MNCRRSEAGREEAAAARAEGGGRDHRSGMNDGAGASSSRGGGAVVDLRGHPAFSHLPAQLLREVVAASTYDSLTPGIVRKCGCSFLFLRLIF